MTTQHTPAPWTFNKAKYPDNTGGFDFAIEHGGQIIAEVFQHTGWQDNTEKEYVAQPVEANARLIAAAPELLEALELFVNAHREPHDKEGYVAREKALSAIAKARG